MLQGVEDEFRDMVVGQAIYDVLPLPASRYQPFVAQYPQSL